MHNIIPAIIPKSEIHLRTELARLRFAPRVQIDVVDGIFVENVSWPYEPAGHPQDVCKALENFEIAVDLMVDDQYSAAVNWLEAGAREIIIHLEAIDSLDPFLSLKNDFDFRLLVAADDDVEISNYVDQILFADGVQLMGIDEIGAQGQPISTRIIDNIKELKSLFPFTPVTVDGGVNEVTLPYLFAAGADHFVVGSAIVKSPNPRESYNRLQNILLN